MRWTVSGADRNNGNPRSMVVEADTREDATRTANIDGLVVADCSPIDTLVPQHEPEHPRYDGLTATSRMMSVAGLLLVLVGLAALIGGVAKGYVEIAISGVSSLIFGVLYFGAASALEALRDIARNSWRR